MELTLKVAPEQLMTTADEFSTIGNQVRSITAENLQKMTNLSGIYESEEATAYIAKARGLEDDIEKLNAMIQEHVNDLNEMARRYIDANTSVSDLISTLSSDVIV
ncbi:MAG: hypothetical protein E7434_01910 [Ruminococcaceae bacterium]|nr:hypothetical protein [Oscillospiraceae bacterium]